MSIIYINPFQFAAAPPSGYDPDAQAYITAVEAADGQSLETAVKDAINAFFVGCKADVIFSALKASCILAGARTLNGALVPLVSTMPAPTNYGFTSADYNRKTGLQGDRSLGKYLDTNRNNNADPQNNKHLAAYMSVITSTLNNPVLASSYNINGGSCLGRVGSTTFSIAINATGVANATPYTSAVGFMGASRSTSTTIDYRYVSGASVVSGTLAEGSQPPENKNIEVFRVGGIYTDPGASFYSIGESLDLALLDARVSTLMSDLAAAIP